MDDAVRGILTGPRNAWLATLMADGSPQVTPVWIDVIDADVVLCTTADTVKAANMRRDPCVAIAIESAEDRYRVVTLRGRVVSMEEGGADALVDALSWRHDGHAWEGPQEEGTAVLVRIHPDRITLLED